LLLHVTNAAIDNPPEVVGDMFRHARGAPDRLLAKGAATTVQIIPRALNLAPGIASQHDNAPPTRLGVGQGRFDLLVGVPESPLCHNKSWTT